MFRSPRRLVFAISLALLASCGTVASAPSPPSSSIEPAIEVEPLLAKRVVAAGGKPVDIGDAVLSDIERRSLQLLNDERATVGAAPLSVAFDLTQSARIWADDMRRNGFRHTPKAGMQQLLGDDRERVGENIAYWSSPSGNLREAALRLQDLWRNSPSHYDNQIDRRWTIVGVGVVRDASGWWAVHQFA